MVFAEIARIQQPECAAKTAPKYAPSKTKYAVRIHKITITASPSLSSDENDMRNFTWVESNSIEDLEMVVAMISEVIQERKITVAKPIET